MDTELLEAEELDVDQTRSARHERPASPRFPPLLTFKRLADDLRFALGTGPPARRPPRKVRARWRPVEERPLSGCR
jgi:hypothetical protein